MNLAPSCIGATVCWSNIFALCVSHSLSGICACDSGCVCVCVCWRCNGNCKSMRKCMFVCEFTTKFILSTSHNMWARAICRFLSRFHDCSFYYHPFSMKQTYTYTQAQSMLCSASWSTSRVICIRTSYIVVTFWCWCCVLRFSRPVQGEPAYFRSMYVCMFVCMHVRITWAMCYVHSGEQPYSIQTQLNSTRFDSTELNSIPSHRANEYIARNESFSSTCFFFSHETLACRHKHYKSKMSWTRDI